MGMVRGLRSLFGARRQATPSSFAKSRPLRNDFVNCVEADDGTAVLSAPIDESGSRFIVWMARRKGLKATKQFELEAVGAYVWALCDGGHTFETISRKLREKYKMSRPESDAALLAFLRMLSQRRLITLVVQKKG